MGFRSADPLTGWIHRFFYPQMTQMTPMNAFLRKETADFANGRL